jgi:hypothetical protein
MTLAETASNFGEMILLDGLMSDPGMTPETKAYLLDKEMLRAHGYLINIPMRYEFEKSFYTERASGEVSVSRLRELMTDAQRKLVLQGILWLGRKGCEKKPGWKHTIKFSANTMEECSDLPKVGRFAGWICVWKRSGWNCDWLGKEAGRFARNVARA